MMLVKETKRASFAALTLPLDQIDVETNSIPRGVSGSEVVVNWPTPPR